MDLPTAQLLSLLADAADQLVEALALLEELRYRLGGYSALPPPLRS